MHSMFKELYSLFISFSLPAQMSRGNKENQKATTKSPTTYLAQIQTQICMILTQIYLPMFLAGEWLLFVIFKRQISQTTETTLKIIKQSLKRVRHRPTTCLRYKCVQKQYSYFGKKYDRGLDRDFIWEINATWQNIKYSNSDFLPKQAIKPVTLKGFCIISVNSCLIIKFFV